MSSAPTYNQYEEPTAELTMDIVDEALPSPAFSRPSPPSDHKSALAPSPSRPVVAVGQLLARRFQLTELIGRGGSALVFRATDLDAGPSGPRVVAVKTSDPERPRANGAERLRHEFVVAKSLTHPAIVSVFEYDGGKTDDDPAFFTMELLEGRTLASAMRAASESTLPTTLVKSVLQAAGDALCHAHQRGVVHGDFKPANVFLSGNGRISVLDFGNADNGEASESRDARAATACYASPEVLLGQRPQSSDDVFSFACVAYELLSGKHPFARQSAIDARAARLRPVRPWSLREAQWKSLDAALSLARESRPALDTLLATLFAEPPGAPAPPLLSEKIPVGIATNPRKAAKASQAPATTRRAATDPPTLSKASRDFFASALATAALLMTLVIVVTEWNSYPALKDDVTSSIASFLRRDAPHAPPAALVPPATGTPAAEAKMEATSADGTVGQPGAPSDPSPRADTYGDAGLDPAQAPVRDTATTATPARAVDPRRRDSTPAAIATYIAFSESAVTVGERTSAVALSVQRSGSLTGRNSIRWRATSATARAGQDFIASSGLVAFPEGHDLRILYIPLVNDTVPEENERFLVQLIEPDARSLVGPVARVTVTITDDD